MTNSPGALPAKSRTALVPTGWRSIDQPIGHRLTDGRVVTLVPLGCDDHGDMGRFLEALAPSSRRLRFLQAMPTVSPRVIREMVEVDQRRHVAWAARMDDRLVGEARYVRLRAEPSAAEVALAVAEDVRRIGLGRLLLEALGVIARAEGLDTLTSSVSDENRASTGLLRSLGSRFHFEGGVLEGRGPVPEWTGSPAAARHIVDRHHASTYDTTLAA
jgi:GNAT superfamily N-acetyltransferase